MNGIPLMYCNYWNLKNAPFDNVPDPAMYADCHTSMENVISETLFAIREANESFAVIISDAGVGKTLSLRMIAETLDPNQYKFVFITNPSLSFPQLLKEIIFRITEEKCEETQKGDLLEMLKNLLIASKEQGKKVVIFIDEANALSPDNLEELRLLTNMQDDSHNLFTLVLAGNLELAERLEHPKQASLFQRIGTYGRIDKLPSIDAVKAYIEIRLKQAGTNIRIFSDDSIPAIWEYSEHGIPRLINKICKLCLKAGETNQFDYISAETATQIASRFRKLSPATVQIADYHRCETEPKMNEEKVSNETITAAPPESEPSVEAETASNTKEEKTENVILFPIAVDTELLEEQKPEHDNICENIQPPIVTADTDQAELTETSGDIHQAAFEETSVQKPEAALAGDYEEAIPELPDADVSAISDVAEEAAALSSIENAMTTEKDTVELISEMNVAVEEQAVSDLDRYVSNIEEELKELNEAVCEIPIQDITASQDQGLEGDVIVIGEHRIPLSIPKDILKQVKTFNRENANKSAGFWAAQIIKKNPQLTLSPQSDPVHVWNEIKDNILRKIAI